MTKKKQEWVCPRCKNRLVTFLPVTGKPTCNNHEEHRHRRGETMIHPEEVQKP